MQVRPNCCLELRWPTIKVGSCPSSRQPVGKLDQQQGFFKARIGRETQFEAALTLYHSPLNQARFNVLIVHEMGLIMYLESHVQQATRGARQSAASEHQTMQRKFLTHTGIAPSHRFMV